MDPQACLDLVQQHIDDHDLEEAAWSLGDFWTWVESGGFTDPALTALAWDLHQKLEDAGVAAHYQLSGATQ